MKINWGTGTDMTRRAPGITLAVMLLLAVPALGQQYYLYAPVPLDREEKVQRQDGILVREVPVQKGDTLFGLSRKFSGHGNYFSQILLFNNISNPDLIYAGDTLKVPVTRKQPTDPAKSTSSKRQDRGPGAKDRPGAILPKAGLHRPAPKTELAPDDLKQTESIGAGKQPKQERAKAPAHTSGAVDSEKAVSASPQSKPQEQPADSASATGQKLYEGAMKAYRQDDCRTALDLFDRFLAADPTSPLAADASLYKAECYLKQASQ